MEKHEKIRFHLHVVEYVYKVRGYIRRVRRMTLVLDRHRHNPHTTYPQISLLVPFRANTKLSAHRVVMWAWLFQYWRNQLPNAEIIIGESFSKVFSKTEAVNDAARHARGRIFVILDADCYIEGSVIQHCADEIDKAIERGNKLWYIPYKNLYRLTEIAAERVLNSDPLDSYKFSSPPPDDAVESTLGSLHGKRFGALIQIMPREAFELVNGMDASMSGWGAEDICMVRAVDTLYIHHKITDNDVLHLWHATSGTSHMDRLWPGQTSPRANEKRASRYNLATGDRVRMRNLVDEALPKKLRDRRRPSD